MLSTLTVWNFALLARTEINFGTGLNILTGETGAGKSILIDALGAVLGHRLSVDMIRTGCEWLRVEAVFDIEGEPALIEYLKDEMIDLDGTELIITRQLTDKGKNSVLVNGCRTTLTVLKNIGEFLFDIHGQNENLALLKTENKFRLVDGAVPEIKAALGDYKAVYGEWQSAKKELKELEESLAETAEKKDLLTWQAEEIEKVKPAAGEYEKLEAEVKKLANGEKIAEDISEISGLLGGVGEAPGVADALSQVIGRLEHMSRYDDSLDDLIDRLENDRVDIVDVFARIDDYHDSLDFDPNYLDRLQGRLDKLDRLRKKFGPTIEAVLERYEEIKRDLSLIENGDGDAEALRRKVTEADSRVREAAEKLTALRNQAAEKISKDITGELKELGMEKACFKAEIRPGEGCGEMGADEPELLFSGNDGEPLKPLAKVASGGELSRISLAIKSAAAEGDSLAPSMVFDEIDTGIGGRTAQMVALRIAKVAKSRQVLCITHLAAIASMADRHLYLAKESENGQTTTTVRVIDGQEEVAEIARMASGLEMSEAAIANAREMLEHAAAAKKGL
ncbi:MAG: DNA repair protein RecN [Selenomonadaceae bacterium]|nr:DNA repair protein RecN [Selenomonadaceae bacterium]